MAESKHVKEIRAFFKDHPLIEVIRVHSGKVKVRRGMMQLARPGTTDFVCCLHGGRFLGVEVKADAKSKRKNNDIDTLGSQTKFRERIEKLGGIVITVCSLLELQTWIHNYFDEAL